MFRKSPWPQLTIFLLVTLISVAVLNNSFAGNEQMYLKLDKGLFYLKQVYETISQNYVDEVDPEGLSKSAIHGIVEELDPYTVFFEKKGSEHLDIITKGKYGGLGMEISKQEGEITVISPIDNTPAQRAGIRAGDIIVTISDETTEKLTLEQASSKLRGPAGTEVTLEIIRPGLNNPIKLTLIREDIVIKDISYAGFVEPGTAFLRLSSFSDKAASELKESIRKLEKRGEIKRVILDLRGNPGGLLASAVEVSNVFLPKGELIVETRGNRERETKFDTPQSAMLPDVPLVVLVDGGSASASEIVAGAIQDLDRGVVIGSRTFGKGLVQQIYPVDKVNDAFLKITTAKYYIPSGRCIQKDDYKKNKDVFINMSDTSDFNDHKKYHTRNGRIVYGGGGISPDIKVDKDRMNQYMIALWVQGHFFKFTVDYLAKHPDIKVENGFQVTDQIRGDFQLYLSEKEMDFEIEGEEELENFLELAEQENYSNDMVDLVEVALQKLEKVKTTQFNKNIERIKESLEAEFAEKLGGNSARIVTLLKYDETVDAALEILQKPEEYQQILAVKN
ncbi:MAG: PDZ domain-containing protein [Calditrichae bacterium]|nr:PDZ domain-containing protein [Calditrichia bacterium]